MSYYGVYTEPEWDSTYDSTWDEDEEEEEATNKRVKTSHQHNRQGRAARDMQNYRRGYPDDLPKKNLQFYQNKIRFEPNGEYIDYIHEHWRYRYDILESNHNFIQWLFPLRERGVNWHALPLTVNEIEMMKKDKKVMERILESYRLMLGFYGIVLVDVDTGMVARAEHNWEERFNNLNWNTHNNLRITRILKCLGEMGYDQLQAPLVRFFLEETLCNGNLPNVRESALEYFMFAVKDKKERQKLVHFAWTNYKPQELFRWGPADRLRTFDPLLQDSEPKCEVDVQEEAKMMADTSEYNTTACNEVSENKPENKRGGLVRRFLGPFIFLFRFVFSSFLGIFRYTFKPFIFLRGYIFGFRGEAKKEDGGQISVETEGISTEKTKGENTATVKTSEEYDDGSEEHKRLHKDHESKKNSKEKAKLEGEAKGNKYGQAKENYRSKKDSGKNTNYIKIANDEEFNWAWTTSGGEQLGAKERRKEEDNDTEVGKDLGECRKDNWARKHVVETTKISRMEDNGKPLTTGSKDNGSYTGTQNPLSETDNIDEKPDDGFVSILETDKTMEPVAKFSRESDPADNAGMGKIEDNGNPLTVGLKKNDGMISGNQNPFLETDEENQVKKDDGKEEDGLISSREPFTPFNVKVDTTEKCKNEDNGKPLAEGSKNNDGMIFGTQNPFLETVKAEQVEKDDGKEEDGLIYNREPFQPFCGEGDAADNAEMGKTKDSGNPLTVDSKDDNERNSESQNSLLETDFTMEPVAEFSRESDPADNAGMGKIEDNGNPLTVGSKNNDGIILGTQNPFLETDEAEQVEKDDGKEKDGHISKTGLFTKCSIEGDTAEMCKNEDNGKPLTVGSKNNDGIIFGTQNPFLETDEAEQVERDDSKEEDGRDEPEPAFTKEGDVSKHSEMKDNEKPLTVDSKDEAGRNTDDGDNEKTKEDHASIPVLSVEEDAANHPDNNKKEGNGESLTVESNDNDGKNTRTQNTLSVTDNPDKVERDEGKPEDEGAPNMKPVPPFSREYDSKIAEISNTEGNTKSSVERSKGNDGLNIGTQNKLPEIDKPKWVPCDETREAEEADNDGLNTGTQNALQETYKAELVQTDEGAIEDERAVNVGQLPQNDEERDEDDTGINTREGNRNVKTMESTDNAGEDIRTQTTNPEKDKTN